MNRNDRAKAIVIAIAGLACTILAVEGCMITPDLGWTWIILLAASIILTISGAVLAVRSHDRRREPRTPRPGTGRRPRRKP